jgi:hypothetical protein
MSLVSKTNPPDHWLGAYGWENPPKIYRILHLRDAVFLDDMYFKGREAAEQYLHKHMCKVAGYLSSEFIPMSEVALAAKMMKVVNDNKPHLFEIVEV